MVDRGRLLIATVVVAGHVSLVALLARAMRLPPEAVRVDEPVMQVELVSRQEPPPAPGREAPPDPLPERRPVPDTVPGTPVRRTRPPAEPPPPAAEETPMQVEVAGSDAPPAWRPPPPGELPLWPQEQAEQGFGRQDVLAFPDARRPRIAGEAAPGARLPAIRTRPRIGAREVVGMVGALLGTGGADAQVEAPCGGRVNGGSHVAQGFAPAWSGHYGCSDTRTGAGFDGTFAQPPGTVRGK